MLNNQQYYIRSPICVECPKKVWVVHVLSRTSNHININNRKGNWWKLVAPQMEVLIISVVCTLHILVLQHFTLWILVLGNSYRSPNSQCGETAKQTALAALASKMIMRSYTIKINFCRPSHKPIKKNFLNYFAVQVRNSYIVL